MLLARPDRLLRWDVLEEHLSEAAFLGTQWESALTSARFTLEELQRGLEQRLLLHLEALAAAGPIAANRLLLPALAGEESETIRAAALALLCSGPTYVPSLLPLLTDGEPCVSTAVQRAIQLRGGEALAESLKPLLVTGPPQVQMTVLEILRFLQVSPGPALTTLCNHDVPEVQAAALRAARLWPEAVQAQRIHAALDSPVTTVREAGLELGLVCGMRRAWKACQEWGQENASSGSKARLLLALGGNDAELAQLLPLLEAPTLRRDVLWALGFSGRMVAANACLAWLNDRACGAVAAEAFCAITGLRLAGPFVKKTDETEEPAGTAGDDDALLPGADDELVAPEPLAIQQWWAQARLRFDPDTRYLGGRPFTPDRLSEALRTEPMRRRAPLALELAIRSRGRHQLEVNAFARIQARQLQTVQPEALRGLHAKAFATWMSA
ncbi:TIGR02270 family protein [Myxococcaceae bacterium JPH2]|nr:TIGR02270 family protein [Myxococcaceae bacterium JPH2]